MLGRLGESYRGHDRRAAPVASTLAVGGMCAAVALLVVVCGIVMILVHDTRLAESRFALPFVRLDVGSSLLASVTAVACFLRWRLVGTASAFWAGLAVFVLGASGFSSTDVTREYAAAGIACSVVGLGLVAVWLRSHEVDASLSVRKSLVLTLVALVVAVGGARFLVGHDLAGAALSVGIGVALLAAAIAARVARTRDRWIVVVLAAYGATNVAYAAAPITDPFRMAGSSLVHLTAMAMAAFGSTLLLHEAGARQREVAFRLGVEHDEAKERFADTLHEVRSTVTALEGGVSTFGPANNDPAQEVLSRALVAEIQRLRALVDDRPNQTAPQTFWLCDVLEPVLTVQVAAGGVVSWDIPGDIHAVGRSCDVAQVVHALLTNAHRHAPGSVVDVVVEREGDFALIRVEDRGPGVAPQDREMIFERGERGSADDDDGRGLGLHIARTIARSQGGDLRVEERPGGGASFVLTVPTVTVLPSADRERDRAGAGTWSHPLSGTDLRSAQ